METDYADNLSLFSDTISTPTQLLFSLELVARGVGLHTNLKLGSLLTINKGPSTTSVGTPINQVDDFTDVR